MGSGSQVPYTPGAMPKSNYGATAASGFTARTGDCTPLRVEQARITTAWVGSGMVLLMTYLVMLAVSRALKSWRYR